MSHRQVPIKVNAFVDQGVSPLVEALSEFPGVITLSSCEGDADGEAFVAFTVGESDWKKTGEFLTRLSTSLRELPGLCDEAAFSLSLEWYAGGDSPSAYVRVPHRHVERLAQAVMQTAACELAGTSAVGASVLVAPDAKRLAV